MQVFGICKGLSKNLKGMRRLFTMKNKNEKIKREAEDTPVISYYFTRILLKRKLNKLQ